MTENELLQLKGDYFVSCRSYKERLDIAGEKFEQMPVIDEVEFWKSLAYRVADSADTAVRAMKQQHENMLAFQFELGKREKEYGFEHKAPVEIKKQWEDHKAACRAKLAELHKNVIR